MVLLVGLVACGSVDSRPPADGPEADAATEADASTDAPVVRCAPTPAGLEARWRGDMTLKDDVGRYDGTAVGQIAYVPGKHGAAFALNGSNTLVRIADRDALWPSGSFSVEAWVNVASVSGVARLITKYECGGNCSMGLPATFANWNLELTAAGQPAFQVRSAPNTMVTITGLSAITGGAWHHVVGVRDIQAKQLLLYVDGELAVSAPLSGHQLDPLTNIDGEEDPVTIGATRDTAATTYIDYLPGAIDEVAYFSAAVNAEEVQAIHAAPEGECRQ